MSESVELFGKVFSEPWFGGESVQVELKRLEALWLDETDNMINTLLCDVQSTYIDIDIRVWAKFRDGKNISHILIIE